MVSVIHRAQLVVLQQFCELPRIGKPYLGITSLSFLSMFMQVERHRTIKLRYQDLASEWQEANAGDQLNLSELLQHEIDHLDGILAIDRMVDVKTLCVREEFEKRYRASSPYADTMPVQTS
jgi:Polypeptide deformylase